MPSKPSKTPKSTPAAEWIAAALGAALIALTLGTLFYEAISQQQSPPDLLVEVVAVAPVRAGYRVEFRISNAGSQAASDVRLRGAIRNGGTVVEAAEVVIDYVAGGATASGALQFSHDPRAAELSVQAVGYRHP